MSSEAKLAVLDDLLQETDGLWVVLGRDGNEAWVTCVCTTQEAADAMYARCRTWSRQLVKLRHVRWMLNDSHCLYDACPDTGLLASRARMDAVLWTNSHPYWEIQHCPLRSSSGVFNVVGESLYPKTARRRYEILSTKIEKHGFYYNEWRATIVCRDSEDGTESRLEMRHETEGDARFWIRLRRAILEDEDPLHALEELVQQQAKEQR